MPDLADLPPERLQGQLHIWTMHALSAFRQQIEPSAQAQTAETGCKRAPT
jgi:hypothetical protein